MTTIISGLRYRGKRGDENQKERPKIFIEESIDKSNNELDNNFEDSTDSKDSDEDSSDEELDSKSSNKESVESHIDPVKLSVKKYDDKRIKEILKNSVKEAIGDFDLTVQDRNTIYHFTQKKIGFKKVVCVQNNMEPIIELLALVLIPDSIDIVQSMNSDYEGRVEADVVYVHSLFVPHKPDVDILNAVFVRNLPQYQIPIDFYSKYSCVEGTGNMERYYPSALVKKSFIRGITFYTDLNDALKVKIMDDIDKLSTSDLKKREIATAMFMLKLKSMISKSNVKNEKQALKKLTTETRGNLIGIVNRLNKMKIGRDAMEMMIIEDAINDWSFETV